MAGTGKARSGEPEIQKLPSGDVKCTELFTVLSALSVSLPEWHSSTKNAVGAFCTGSFSDPGKCFAGPQLALEI